MHYANTPGPSLKFVCLLTNALLMVMCRRFTTDSGRCSKWLGKPINHALTTKVSLSGQGKHETLIGIYGTADSIRILTLGIKVRQVTKVGTLAMHIHNLLSWG